MPLVTALHDANVLYLAPLRDLLMRVAAGGLVQAKWTDAIHEEWIRNLLADRPGRHTRGRLERTRDLMNQHAGDCLVVGYDHLVPTLDGIHEGDRHVAAAGNRGRG